MKKGVIVGAVALSTLGLILIGKKASGGENNGAVCFRLNYIGTGSDEPYYYATWLGTTMPLNEAFGDAINDLFIVQYQYESYPLWRDVSAYTEVQHNQFIRFQVVRTTEICGFRLESEP